jgi:hypothetical protein
MASAQPERHALLFLVEKLTFDRALSDQSIGALARAGGIGLMTNAGPLDLFREPEGPTQPGPLSRLTRVWLGSRDTAVIAHVLRDLDGEVLAIVAGRGGREGVATPLILARGQSDELLAIDGEPSGLTSETTRREGVVSNVDLEPTIRAFLGAPAGRGPGSTIRIEGEAPTELAERYEEWRRSVAPVGVTVLVVALTSLAVALVMIGARWSGPARAVAVWVLFSEAMLVALLPAGLLPDLRTAVVLPAVTVLAAVLTAAALAVGRGSAPRPIAVVGGVGLGVVVLDAAFGWPLGVTPFLGGSALEGVRFFGLGNPSAGIVLSGAVLAAAFLRPWAGVALLLGAGLFAGLPFLGADLGGGLALFAAAAVWYALRVRGRVGWREVGLAVAALVAGAAVLVVVHTALPSPATHVARAVEGAGPIDLLGVFADRLRANLEATSTVPAAWLAVVGLPAWLVVIWRRPGAFRAPLDADEAWRHAAATLALGGMLGYVLNDTHAMAAVAFVFVSAAVVIPSLRWMND